LGWQDWLLGVVPLCEAAAGAGRLAEDKARKDVEATDREEEERRDERERRNMVRKDRGTNPGSMLVFAERRAESR
jgi:hypothetical protein